MKPICGQLTELKRHEFYSEEAVIPRYHLHLVSCDQPIIDADGIEADGDHDVCAGALEVISEVRADPEQFAKWRDWYIEIVEDTGRMVVTIPFAPRAH